MPAAVEIDRADIQGDILRAHGNTYVRTTYVFLNVADAGAGREWLNGRVDDVASDADRPRGERPDSVFNLAFTCAGLAALGVPPHVLDSFSKEFRAGMAGRAELLGDVGPSAPSGWDEGFGIGRAHVLVTINARTDELLEAALEDLVGGLPAGMSAVHVEHGKLLEGSREHFGYADGFAQPAIEGVSQASKVRGGGVPLAGGGWRPLALGEFILGYEDEESRDDPERRLPSAPDAPLGKSGTYMVWRKLYQDVAMFRRSLRDAARAYHGGDEEKLAAKVAGRWRDGTPLVLSPDAPDPGFRPEMEGGNDFRYADSDQDGHRCPIGAHIRRSNPRDALGWEGRLSFRHRMIRRGMPYGPPLEDGVFEDDGVDRGLVFACFVASISRQFEAVQIQWLNDGNIMHQGHDRDFMLGDPAGKGKMTVQGDPPFFLGPQGPYVSTRGGEYLFVPGVTALAAIAAGVTG